MFSKELSDNLEDTMVGEGRLPSNPITINGINGQRNKEHSVNRKTEGNIKVIDLYSNIGWMFGIDRSIVYRIVRPNKFQKLGPVVSNGIRKPKYGENAQPSKIEVIHPSKKSGEILGQKQKKLQDYHVESERNKIIIDLYYHHLELTLSDIGQKFGISAPRILEIARTHELHKVWNRIDKKQT